jgi:sterol desaturase/sphingolipid hydroxylase (fatty acid hydroxylase superfamily)
MVPDVMHALWKIASTVRDDFAEAFTSHLSPISWIGALRFVVYAGFALALGMGFNYAGGGFRWLPRRVFLSRSFVQDLGITFANSVIFAAIGLVITLDAFQERVTTAVQSGLFSASRLLATAPPSSAPRAWWVKAISVAAVILAIDLGAYCYHRLMHRVRFLWEFHKVHHSAPTLNAATVYRVHPVDMILRALVTAVLLGVVTGALRLSFGAEQLTANVALGFQIYAVLLAYLAVLNHSHVWWSWGGFERVLNSPAMHAIHHSRDRRHHDRNFAALFSFWDVMFGSFYQTTKAPETLTLGVDDTDWSSMFFLGLLALPFVRAFRPRS